MARPGLTFDTGALIALERHALRIREIHRLALRDGVPITVPVAVVIEWWRGRTDARERILRGIRIEALDLALAKVAGEAIAATTASAVDAVVMASAALRGDIVYTSDVGDLGRLRPYFPNVRVLAV